MLIPTAAAADAYKAVFGDGDAAEQDEWKLTLGLSYLRVITLGLLGLLGLLP